jgi:hypothetical protein
VRRDITRIYTPLYLLEGYNLATVSVELLSPACSRFPNETLRHALEDHSRAIPAFKIITKRINLWLLKKRLLVRLSPELKTQLEERSRKDRGTQSETLRIAIEQFVDADMREPVGARES